MHTNLRVSCLLIACLSLAACGSGENAAPLPTAQTPAKTAPARANTTVSSRIKAVAAEPGTSPVGLEFELLSRPALNEAVEIKLYLLGVNDVADLQLTVKPEGRLQVVEGAEAKLPALKTGETLEHGLKVRSDTAGMMIADVQVQATVAGQPRMVSFSIPVAFIAPK